MNDNLLLSKERIMNIVRLCKTIPNGHGGHDYREITPLDLEAAVRMAVEACTKEAVASLKAWGDDVALRGPEAPKWDGQIKHLIEYLLTVYKRFGNTAITADLQWGATALWKRDEQRQRIVDLESKQRFNLTASQVKQLYDFSFGGHKDLEEAMPVTIGYLPEHESGPGWYVWPEEYPEEGSLPLVVYAKV